MQETPCVQTDHFFHIIALLKKRAFQKKMLFGLHNFSYVEAWSEPFASQLTIMPHYRMLASLTHLMAMNKSHWHQPLTQRDFLALTKANAGS